MPRPDPPIQMLGVTIDEEGPPADERAEGQLRVVITSAMGVTTFRFPFGGQFAEKRATLVAALSQVKCFAMLHMPYIINGRPGHGSNDRAGGGDESGPFPFRAPAPPGAHDRV